MIHPLEPQSSYSKLRVLFPELPSWGTSYLMANKRFTVRAFILLLTLEFVGFIPLLHDLELFLALPPHGAVGTLCQGIDNKVSESTIGEYIINQGVFGKIRLPIVFVTSFPSVRIFCVGYVISILVDTDVPKRQWVYLPHIGYWCHRATTKCTR